MIPTLRQNVIDRPRVDLLIGAEPGGVILDAPGGYGKTTALVLWAQKQVGAGRRVKWPLEPLVSSGADVLILDNLPANQDHQIMKEAEFLLATNPDLQVVVSARLFDPAPAAWRRVSIEDLEFTDVEIEELAETIGADNQDRERALEQAGRWPLGIRGTLDGSDLADFVRVLANASPDVLGCATLTLLSFVDRLRPALTQKPLGATEERIEEALRYLEATGILLSGSDSVGRYFTAQRAVRPYLKGLGRIPERVLTDILSAHAVAEEAIRPAHSVKTLLEIGRFAEADLVAAFQFNRLLADKDRALTALRSASLAALEPCSVLLMARLILERPHRAIPIATVEQMARDLMQTLAKQRATANVQQYVWKMPLQVATARMLGIWDEALDVSQQMMGTMDHPDWQESRAQSKESRAEDLVLPIFYAVAALAGVLGGDLTLADRAAQSGYQVATAQGNRLEEIHSLALGALSHALQGEVARAEEKLALVQALGGYEGLTPPEFSWVDLDLARAFVAASRRDVDAGVGSLTNAVPLMGRMEQWPLVVAAESLITRQAKGAVDAHALMRHRLEARPTDREVSPVWQVRLLTGLADLATFSGRYSDAEQTLNQTEDDRELLVAAYPLLLLSRARLLLYRGQYSAVVALVDDQEDTEGMEQVRAELKIIRALANYRLGNTGVAAGELTSLEDLTQWDGFATLVAKLPAPLLLEVAEELGLAQLRQEVLSMPDALYTVQHEALSAAEEDVLEGLANGKPEEQVAADLFISLNTLKSHRRSVYRKLRATSRPEALTAARRLGLIS